MIDGLEPYYVVRFALGVLSVVAWGRLTFRVVGYAARADTHRIRVFYVTVIWLFGSWTLALFATTLVQLVIRAPVPSDVVAAIGLYLQSSVALGGLILARLFPKLPSGS